MTQTLETGLHADVPHEAYHRRELGLASKTALDLVRKAPAVYKAWIDGALDDDEEESEALVFGGMLHCAILEPERFYRQYVVAPDFGNCTYRDNKAARDKWRAENKGRKEVTAKQYRMIQGMADAVRTHPIAGKLFTGGEAEVTLRWTDEATGLRCKGRADYYKVDAARELVLASDLKSTLDATPEGFAKSCANFGYERQAAFYQQGFAAVGKPVDAFIFVAVQKDAPYLLRPIVLGPESIAAGAESIREDMATMAKCLKSGQWPGYDEDIAEVELPAWAFKRRRRA